MALGNTRESFGWLTRALHWSVAGLVLALLPLGLWLSEAEFSLDMLWLFGLHKSLGITVLALMSLRLVWHAISPAPDPIPSGSRATDGLARWVHRLFYVVLIAMPLSGWFGSSATGIDTVLFNRWTLPPIAPVSETWETVGFAVHGGLGLLAIALVALHLAGVAYRALAVRDGTLRRILRGRA